MVLIDLIFGFMYGLYFELNVCICLYLYFEQWFLSRPSRENVTPDQGQEILKSVHFPGYF